MSHSDFILRYLTTPSPQPAGGVEGNAYVTPPLFVHSPTRLSDDDLPWPVHMAKLKGSPAPTDEVIELPLSTQSKDPAYRERSADSSSLYVSGTPLSRQRY